MKNKLLKYIFPFLLCVLIFTPIFGVSASAEDPNEDCRFGPLGNELNPPCQDRRYNFLEPLPCTDTADPNCVGGEYIRFNPADDPANPNSVGRYLNLMIKIFIGVCAVLAMVMIVAGGLEYMTSELISSKEHAKERIRNAIFGLLLALGAYTILFTINPDLLETDVKIKKQTIEVVIDDDIPQTTDAQGRYKNGMKRGDDWAVASGQAQVPLPIGKKNNECRNIGDSNCTSTRGLSLAYINMIRSNCPTCELTLTGGTEFWLHGGPSGNTSHRPGSPTVDLRNTGTPALNQYIRSGEKLKENWYRKDGMLFFDEGDHWHVQS